MGNYVTEDMVCVRMYVSNYVTEDMVCFRMCVNNYLTEDIVCVPTYISLVLKRFYPMSLSISSA